MPITEANCVYFDINTTGKKGERYKITQIGAVNAGSDECFDQKPDEETSIATVLENFFEWLQSLKEGPVYLVAHNARRFDKEVLEGAAERETVLSLFARNYRIPIPTKVVAGYFDSLDAFRKHFKKELQAFSMDDLARYFGQARLGHDALRDSQLLKKLVRLGLAEKRLRMQTFFNSESKSFMKNNSTD